MVRALPLSTISVGSIASARLPCRRRRETSHRERRSRTRRLSLNGLAVELQPVQPVRVQYQIVRAVRRAPAHPAQPTWVMSTARATAEERSRTTRFVIRAARLKKSAAAGESSLSRRRAHGEPAYSSLLPVCDRASRSSCASASCPAQLFAQWVPRPPPCFTEDRAFRGGPAVCFGAPRWHVSC
jgi:hypothetical protein